MAQPRANAITGSFFRVSTHRTISGEQLHVSRMICPEFFHVHRSCFWCVFHDHVHSRSMSAASQTMARSIVHHRRSTQHFSLLSQFISLPPISQVPGAVHKAVRFPGAAPRRGQSSIFVIFFVFPLQDFTSEAKVRWQDQCQVRREEPCRILH